MRIITWNACHGGGSRAESFAKTIVSLEPDVAIVTEYRNGKTGNLIKTILVDAGLSYFSHVSTPAKLNTVLIISRTPMQEKKPEIAAQDAHRCAWVYINGIDILGLYFPQKKAKAILFDAICSLDPALLLGQALLVGDFNTGKHFLDEQGQTFHCADYFDKLEKLGWIDAWRSRNRNACEYSWYSSAGNGFRIDHALATPKLNQMIRNVNYKHSVREAGLSDHSAMIIDISSSNA